MDDLRRYLPLLDPDAPGRFTTTGDRALIRLTKLFHWPLGMIFAGLFATYRYLLGLERFMLSIYDAPEMLHEIGRAWERHVVGIAQRLAPHRPVWVTFWEDMCYRNGMFISPKSYREFITPYFRRAVQGLYDAGVEFTMVDSDGDVTKLIPLLEEVGIKGMMPFEVQAGMDIREIRRRHPRLVIFGGLDKRLLAQSRDAMDKEIEEKAVPLAKSGGYVPGLDHAVPPDVSLADFRWCLERLRGLQPR
jgi:uroporphyrinogen-III decarboxylase